MFTSVTCHISLNTHDHSFGVRSNDNCLHMLRELWRWLWTHSGVSDCVCENSSDPPLPDSWVIILNGNSGARERTKFWEPRNVTPNRLAVGVKGHPHVLLPAMLVQDASFGLPMLMRNAVDILQTHTGVTHCRGQPGGYHQAPCQQSYTLARSNWPECVFMADACRAEHSTEQRTKQRTQVIMVTINK